MCLSWCGVTCSGLPVAAGQPGRRGGVVEAVAEPVGGQPAAAFDEQEVGGPLQPGMGQGPLRAAPGASTRRARRGCRRRAGRCVRCRACRAGPSASCRGWPSPRRSRARGRAVRPSRMPVPRRMVSPVRANGSASSAIAAIRSRSASGGSARGSGLSSRGMSVGNSSRPVGRSAHPQKARSSKKQRRSMTVRLLTHRGHGLVTGDPTAPGPTVVVGEEAFDVLAGELGQAAHLWVVGGQVLGEDDQAVGAQLDRVGPQGGRHRVQVAQGDLADAGLADRGCAPLVEGGLAGPGLPWRMLADPQLVAGLVQAERRAELCDRASAPRWALRPAPRRRPRSRRRSARRGSCPR